MKEYGTKTFGQLNAGRYDAMYEASMVAETTMTLRVSTGSGCGGSPPTRSC